MHELFPVTRQQRRDQIFLLAYCASPVVWLLAFIVPTALIPSVTGGAFILPILSLCFYLFGSPWAFALARRTKDISSMIAASYPLLCIILGILAFVHTAIMVIFWLYALCGGMISMLAALYSIVTLSVDLTTPHQLILGCGKHQALRQNGTTN